VQIAGWRFKALVISAVAGAAGYLGISLWSGWEATWDATARVGVTGVAVALAMSLANYGLRFVRWQMYLGALGHRPPWLASGQIYLAGFALTTTPGKAGEAIRSVFLKRWGVSYAASLAAFLSERLSDLFTIVLLALLGLSFYPEAQALVGLGAAAVALAMIVFSQERLLRRWHARSRTARGWVGRWGHHVLHLLLEARRCHRPILLVTAAALSLVAWSAEALAFHWVLRWLGADFSMTFAFFVYALAMLAGAISFLPGGLGGTEAVMVGLLTWQGLALPQAVAATVLIRLATLWFAVGLGIVALLSGREDKSAT
jgi:uncharacterized membrane protein YbhN (UPF0104 family)